jgi:hypothetical protein
MTECALALKQGQGNKTARLAAGRRCGESSGLVLCWPGNDRTSEPPVLSTLDCFVRGRTDLTGAESRHPLFFRAPNLAAVRRIPAFEPLGRDFAEEKIVIRYLKAFVTIRAG